MRNFIPLTIADSKQLYVVADSIVSMRDALPGENGTTTLTLCDGRQYSVAETVEQIFLQLMRT